jgi:hypothetical protein
VLFAIDIESRGVEIVGIGRDPDGRWMEQMARNLDNTLMDGISPDTDGVGPVACRERLSGLLNFYHREAA